ncbi:hypothetical protein NEOLEDRAFT_1175161 [Neolentinus lepideus HHB14362 ss-1]|uniref:Uncharacterized protein n=1 Tax=Neolentinus lepideus HHB14362 ss-1 TaxID=1314782 RepID=A0A165VCI5_9AGAM|nr:hypothetical protein NEOLEDRAFT_1175161 [Neolentinus lepideus HHB14362 ss-1]
MNVYDDGSWVRQWDEAVAQGRFSNRRLDSNFSKLEMIERLYSADKAFARDCVWPPLPRAPQLTDYEDSLYELYCQFRYHIGILTFKPDARRYLENPDSVRYPKPNPWRRPLYQDEYLLNFISKPYTTIRLFLTLCFYDSVNGWHLKAAWCRYAPQLISFYVDFLLRVRFYDDEEDIQQLISVRGLLEQAKIELPRTLTIARVLPCPVANGLAILWPNPKRSILYFLAELTSQGSETLDWAEQHFGGLESWNTDLGAIPLVSLLGPTALPLTHTISLAETSTRRIACILRPGSPVPQQSHPVEEELVRHLGRVILKPWGRPRDRRSCLLEPSVEDRNVQGGSARYHDPNIDNITVLMEASVLDSLIVGMGISGTFVQIMPHGRSEDKEGRYWFVENIQDILPSFYIDVPPPRSEPSSPESLLGL